MATSDNVVRAGLTPKLRDVDTLISMLTYQAGPASSQLLKPTPFATDSGTKSMLYDPPIDEFSVVRVALEAGDKETHREVQGPSLVIVTEGTGEVVVKGEKVEVERGEVLFMGAGAEVEWQSGEKGLELFRAFVEV
jgi:mannose-6-phosphate isomerase